MEISAYMLQFEKIKKGDCLSELSYYRVIEVTEKFIRVVNEQNIESCMDREYAEMCLYSADQFNEQRVVTRTEAANLLLHSGSKVFSVVFNKQLDKHLVEKEILEVYENSSPKQFEKVLKHSLKKLLIGEERRLRGFVVDNEARVFGRILVIDLDVERTEGVDNRYRLIDTRTIKELTLNNIKYIIK